jgi:hypothetical protein
MEEIELHVEFVILEAMAFLPHTRAHSLFIIEQVFDSIKLTLNETLIL